jgi:hypothetical protein
MPGKGPELSFSNVILRATVVYLGEWIERLLLDGLGLQRTRYQLLTQQATDFETPADNVSVEQRKKNDKANR